MKPGQIEPLSHNAKILYWILSKHPIVLEKELEIQGEVISLSLEKWTTMVELIGADLVFVQDEGSVIKLVAKLPEKSRNARQRAHRNS